MHRLLRCCSLVRASCELCPRLSKYTRCAWNPKTLKTPEAVKIFPAHDFTVKLVRREYSSAKGDKILGAVEGTNKKKDDASGGAIEVERKFVVGDKCEEKLEELGATLVKTQTFTDVYYDTKDYRWTLADHWLRQRDGVWQLKCPPAQREHSRTTSQYMECSRDADIGEALSRLLPNGTSSKLDVAQIISVAGCLPFAKYRTDRKTYRLNDLKIDLDQTDFGFGVGEVEAIVTDSSQLEGAVKMVDELCQNLGVAAADRVPGKMDTYLKKNNPQLYQRLLDVRVL